MYSVIHPTTKEEIANNFSSIMAAAKFADDLQKTGIVPEIVKSEYLASLKRSYDLPDPRRK